MTGKSKADTCVMSKHAFEIYDVQRERSIKATHDYQHIFASQWASERMDHDASQIE